MRSSLHHLVFTITVCDKIYGIPFPALRPWNSFCFFALIYWINLTEENVSCYIHAKLTVCCVVVVNNI